MSFVLFSIVEKLEMRQMSTPLHLVAKATLNLTKMGRRCPQSARNFATHSDDAQAEAQIISIPPINSAISATLTQSSISMWSVYTSRTLALDRIDRWDQEAIKLSFMPLYLNKQAKDAAYRSSAITGDLWPQVVSKLRRRLLSDPGTLFNNDLAAFQDFVMLAAREVAVGETQVGSIFIDRCVSLAAAIAVELFPDLIKSSICMKESTDLRFPHTWFPKARAMKRRLIFHAGPTNSGKTFRALNALKESHTGVYAGPLRLLALEVYESLNNAGIYTSLLTGQERKRMPFGTHTSSTIEMLCLDTPVDCAVIDEIQMIGDPQRGSSWTRAVLGVLAPEIHLCGDPATEEALQAICAVTGDELEIRRYERLSTMIPLKTSLDSDYRLIRPGDCVVAFSRKDIYAIRKTIELKTAYKCCVVYGQLPPETRSQQAKQFNDPSSMCSAYDVLVASDAIGMGLNLNIRRVVFHGIEKFDGSAFGRLQPSQVKQIAGRAGRHNSRYPEGYATTLCPEDLPYLHECLAAPSPAIPQAGLFPSAEQLIAFSKNLPPATSLARIVELFVSASTLEGPYFLCRSDELKTAANVIQPYPLTLQQRCTLALVPVNLKNSDVRQWFLKYLEAFVAGLPVRLELQLPYADPSYLSRDLEVLETKHSALDAYLWLGYRLGPAGFPDIERAIVLRNEASRLLELALTTLSNETKENWVQQNRRRRMQQRNHTVQTNNIRSSTLQPDRTSPKQRTGRDRLIANLN